MASIAAKNVTPIHHKVSNSIAEYLHYDRIVPMNCLRNYKVKSGGGRVTKARTSLRVVLLLFNESRETYCSTE